MLNNQNILELMAEMNAALDEANAAYKVYVSAIIRSRKAASTLSEELDKIIKQPHIEIEDYEIDG